MDEMATNKEQEERLRMMLDELEDLLELIPEEGADAARRKVERMIRRTKQVLED